MAVKRYDGSAWQTVAGLGAQGAAATSSSIATWVKTASGGETSLSGNDDNSQALSYTIGQELVFINGTLLKRGSDYTATNGTSITGLTALAANDVATVWTVNAFSVTGAIANTIVDAKGDLLVGTAADTPGRLAVGTNDYVLTADSATGTGLKWAAPESGGLTLINTGGTTLSGATTTVGSIPGTYRNLYIVILNYKPATDGARIYVKANGDGGASRYFNANSSTGADLVTAFNDAAWTLSLDQDNSVSNSIGAFTIYEYANTSIWKSIYGQMLNNDDTTSTSISFRTLYGMYNQTTAISSLEFYLSTGNFTSGTVNVYGVL